MFPTLGVSDWTHQGIASLFTNIRKHGFQILYLSARPIGLAAKTKRYVKGIKQIGNQKKVNNYLGQELTDQTEEKTYSMPDGPLLLSPDRMAKSFYTEVIIKKPHLFKIAYL